METATNATGLGPVVRRECQRLRHDAWDLGMLTWIPLGVCLLIGGYHVAAYGSPDPWFPLKVSRSLWWLVPSFMAFALGATYAVDRLVRTNPRS